MTDAERNAIEWECLKLCNAFFHHMDHGDFEAMIGLFAPDGTFLRHGHLLRGHEELRTAMAVRPTSSTTIHLITNFTPLEVEPTRVKTAAYVVALGTFDRSVPVPKLDPMTGIAALEFLDEFRRLPAGWRFAARIARPILHAPNFPPRPPTTAG
jgi:hypothetical protein